MNTPNQQIKRTGRGMWILFWLVFMGLMYLLFQGILTEKLNPNRHPTVSLSDGHPTIVLKQNSQGHYLVNGHINDIPITFLLDTGATQISIPASVADKIGLTRGRRYPVSTANGNSYVYATKLNQVDIGGLQLYNINAGITPTMGGNTVLLGMNALRQFRLVQQGRELSISFAPKD